MIIPEQLRIGNWVYNPAIRTNMQVYPMMIPRLHRIVSEGGQPNIEPIPITEEILLKCGFEWVKPLKAYTHDDMDCEVSLNSKETENHALHELNTKGFGGTIPATYYDGKFYLTSNGEYLVSTNPIQFLHQLQNLYFALTGQELEIKL